MTIFRRQDYLPLFAFTCIVYLSIFKLCVEQRQLTQHSYSDL